MLKYVIISLKMTKLYIIYQIKAFDKNLDFSYVGSTENFVQRKSVHKSDCKNGNKKASYRKIYEYINLNGGFDAFETIPLEEFKCDSKIQVRIREQFYINQLENKLNMIRAYRSVEELKEQKKDNNKKYYEDNVEKLREHNKKYYKENVEKIREHREKNKEKIAESKKKYYEKNIDKFKERARKNYIKNKEKSNDTTK
jgi:mevalonate kinase